MKKTRKRVVIKMRSSKKGTTAVKVHKIKVSKTLKKLNKKLNKTKKICPEGKILNPVTNRCIAKDGAYAKRLIRQGKLK